ncbi:uncharacterized protein LOC18770869 isoform X1 [Prunus persica]|uniref:uncharacterized protein LOC18770869 isoform X1 n=1 Tax=Prunus persica TaxID=3760 RepID=UPI0009ABA8CB|nr:uncharacterized protein LOC18770869 isoform X1 [Prunus persica]
MLFEAKFLCKGTWVTAFKGKEITNWKLHQILPYCSSGIVAGMVGSLLGLGGGFILGPFFLELGIPPQPMLMLGISTGVAFKVMFTDWMVTVVLIILFLVSTEYTLPIILLDILLSSGWYNNKSFNETHINMEERDNDEEGKIFTQLSGSPGLSMSRVVTKVLTRNLRFHMTFRKQKSSWNWCPNVAMVSLQDEQVPISHNIYWKELSMFVYVSVAFLIVHIVKVPIAVPDTLFEAICLCKGTRVIASKGKEITNWKLHQISLYCSCGIVVGTWYGG